MDFYHNLTMFHHHISIVKKQMLMHIFLSKEYQAIIVCNSNYIIIYTRHNYVRSAKLLIIHELASISQIIFLQRKDYNKKMHIVYNNKLNVVI